MEATCYAAAKDIRVARIFKVRGVNGEKELKDRPAFMEMLTALHANGVRTLSIERLLAGFAGEPNRFGPYYKCVARSTRS
jgi:DNA invertase Pin-like site-specific DNA recombinase